MYKNKIHTSRSLMKVRILAKSQSDLIFVYRNQEIVQQQGADNENLSWYFTTINYS